MQLNEDLGSARQQFEVEVFAYGHLPLAYSARCFTARSLDKPKDNCELACIHYPTGRLASSREGQKVFNLNGIQTQSGYCYNLGNELEGMAGLVDVVRLSPKGWRHSTCWPVSRPTSRVRHRCPCSRSGLQRLLAADPRHEPGGMTPASPATDSKKASSRGLFH